MHTFLPAIMLWLVTHFVHCFVLSGSLQCFFACACLGAVLYMFLCTHVRFKVIASRIPVLV